MRILYLHQYFNTPSMSGSTRSYEFARRLVSMGHQVTVLTSWREPSLRIGWFQTNEAGIVVHWINLPYSNKFRYSQRILSFLSFAWYSLLKSKSVAADLVFATSTPLTIAVPGVFAAKRLQAPFVFEVRDLWPEIPIAMGALRNPFFRYAARILERWAYSRSDSIVALSPGIKEGIVRTGYPSAKVSVIPNCSDNNEFEYRSEAAQSFRSARPYLGSRPILSYAGTFGKVNGLRYAIQLAIQLRQINSNIAILLVGDGIERDQILREAENRNLLDCNLYYEQSLPKSQIPSLLSASSMSASFVLDIPVLRNNSANKFFDTLASGTPVFLNHGGWMHDLVVSTGAGFSAWRKPLPLVARELDCKLNDPAWLSNAGSSARKLAENEFDRDLLSIRFEEVLIAAKSTHRGICDMQ